MYQVNDAVLYGIQGVCEIKAIEKKNFSRQTRTYYVLKPVYQKSSTVYVPVENETTVAKMRKVLSANEITQLIQDMPKDKTEWIENDSLRKEKFSKILHGGDREDLIALIKAVYSHKQQLVDAGNKKLHAADESAMKDAERMLYDEFAYVLNIERTEILSFITSQIETNRN